MLKQSHGLGPARSRKDLAQLQHTNNSMSRSSPGVRCLPALSLEPPAGGIAQSVLEFIPLHLLGADTELCSHLSLAPGKAAPCFWLLPKEGDSQ